VNILFERVLGIAVGGAKDHESPVGYNPKNIRSLVGMDCLLEGKEQGSIVVAPVGPGLCSFCRQTTESEAMAGKAPSSGPPSSWASWVLTVLVALLVYGMTGATAPTAATGGRLGPPLFSAGNDRFEVLEELSGEGVLDRETRLVWERTPSPADKNWAEAAVQCGLKPIGGRRGWRLPSYLELMTLVHPVVPPHPEAPALPPGHPFRGIQASNYWTVTPEGNDRTHAYVVDFVRGDLASQKKVQLSPYWCVQGGVARSQQHTVASSNPETL
jgi:hypothetical protein